MTQPPLPQGKQKTAMVRSMFDAIAPRYDVVNKLMTFGLDMSWRRRTIRLLGLAPGSVVADLACGTGDLARLLAAEGYATVGVDLSGGMLAAACVGAPLIQGDVGWLPFRTGAFDGAVSGFALRNFSDLNGVFREAARVVRPRGRIAFLDVDEPENALVRAGYRVFFHQIAPRIGGLLSDREAYRYLPRSVAYLPPRSELLAMLGDAGFDDVEHRALSGGVTQVLTGTRTGGSPW